MFSTAANALSLLGLTSQTEDAKKEQDVDVLLKSFAKPGDKPATSRVDDTVPQLAVQPVSLFESWKYLAFVTGQASSAATALLLHHVRGPVKPSWGVEMTLFTNFLRTSVEYSHLGNIHFLRRILNLGQILPIPKDGIVTPVSFRVKKRGLTGFLSQADGQEDGTRELTAEWVINRRLWKRMQDGYKSDDGRSATAEKVILYLHGGAYYVMSAASHRFLTIQVSKYTDSRIFALNYRLAPETRFPGALHDAVAAYFRLTRDLKIPHQNVVLAGDSAGAGLCTALLLYLRDEGYPLPAGAILMSPWVDLTMSCASWETNAKFDYLPQPSDSDHLHPVKCYLAPQSIKELITHPYVSPLFGDFHGLPPLLIQCGDAERLRDEATLLAHKASLAGVQVEHEVYEDCVHVFQMFGFLEASRKAMRSIRRFVRRTLPSRKLMDPSRIDSQIMADAHAVRDDDAELEYDSLPPTPAVELSSLPGIDDMQDIEDMRMKATAKAARLIGDSAAVLRPSTPPLSPITSTGPPMHSPSRVLRRLPSQSLLMTNKSLRPNRHHTRSQTTSDTSALRVRPRSSSHPSLRALIDEYAQEQDSAVYESYMSGEESDMAASRPDSPRRPAG